MYCRNCGYKLNDNASYCPGCGTKVVPPIRRQYNELITKAISGDDEAFNMLVKTIEPMGYFYARSISGSRATVPALLPVQETSKDYSTYRLPR